MQDDRLGSGPGISRRRPNVLPWVLSACACLWLIAGSLLLTGVWDGVPAWSAASRSQSGAEASPAVAAAARGRTVVPNGTSTPMPRRSTPTAGLGLPESPALPPASQPEAPVSQPTASRPQPTATAVPAGCPTAAMSGYGLALFNAINAQRLANGQSALVVNGCVVYVARLRSDDMAANSYFSHTSPDGSTAFSLLTAYEVRYGWAGENLARNNYPDDETVGVAIRDLMASPGHRDNILNSHYTEMGVAVGTDGSGIRYYTMIFIGPA